MYLTVRGGRRGEGEGRGEERGGRGGEERRREGGEERRGDHGLMLLHTHQNVHRPDIVAAFCYSICVAPVLMKIKCVFEEYVCMYIWVEYAQDISTYVCTPTDRD